MKRRLYILDVFTSKPFEGNALAVVTDGDEISTERMQAVAREMHLSETVFVQRPTNNRALARLRIFTTEHELPLAGHPVIGTWFLLAQSAWCLHRKGRCASCSRLAREFFPSSCRFTKEGRCA